MILLISWERYFFTRKADALLRDFQATGRTCNEDPQKGTTVGTTAPKTASNCPLRSCEVIETIDFAIVGPAKQQVK
jgi:hypothetical protein